MRPLFHFRIPLYSAFAAKQIDKTAGLFKNRRILGKVTQPSEKKSAILKNNCCKFKETCIFFHMCMIYWKKEPLIVA